MKSKLYVVLCGVSAVAWVSYALAVLGVLSVDAPLFDPATVFIDIGPFMAALLTSYGYLCCSWILHWASGKIPENEGCYVQSSRSVFAPTFDLAFELFCQQAGIAGLITIAFVVGAVVCDCTHLMCLPLGFVSWYIISEGYRNRRFTSVHLVSCICAALCTPITQNYTVFAWFCIYASSAVVLGLSLFTNAPKESDLTTPLSESTKSELCADFLDVFRESTWMTQLLFISLHLVMSYVHGNWMYRCVPDFKYTNSSGASSFPVLVGIIFLVMALRSVPVIKSSLSDRSLVVAIVGAVMTSMDSLMRALLDSYPNLALPTIPHGPAIIVVLYILLFLIIPFNEFALGKHRKAMESEKSVDTPKRGLKTVLNDTMTTISGYFVPKLETYDLEESIETIWAQSAPVYSNPFDDLMPPPYGTVKW